MGENFHIGCLSFLLLITDGLIVMPRQGVTSLVMGLARSAGTADTRRTISVQCWSSEDVMSAVPWPVRRGVSRRWTGQQVASLSRNNNTLTIDRFSMPVAFVF